MSEIDKILEYFNKCTNLLNKSDKMLSNPKFLEKAKPEFIEKEKATNADLRQQEVRAYQKIEEILLKYFETDERIFWHVQYSREKRSTFQEYGTEWFQEYMKPVEKIDKYNLLTDVKEFISQGV